jgi:hypothetical protein
VKVHESIETTNPGRPFGKKIRTLAVGALATAALSIPAVSAVSVIAGHEAFRAPVRQQPVRGFSPDSQRLALTITSHSVRLT